MSESAPVRLLRRSLLIGGATACTALGLGTLTGCAGGAFQSGGTGAAASDVVRLVCYAVPAEANQAAETAFRATPAGAGVSFTESYGASGDQSRAVVNGLGADYVHLSVETDVTRLVDAGLVAADWSGGPDGGIVATSIVVIGVRPGNPSNITGWADLARPGTRIVTPNPASSGSAKWNVLAAYAHVLATGGSETDAEAYLTSLISNVQALPGSGRDATAAFLSGDADALISYENEVILARQSGEQLDYVVPDQSVLIENPGTVLVGAPAAATAFRDFVVSDAGQAIFVAKGFRPLHAGLTLPAVPGANDPAAPYPAPTHLTTIADLGGWSAVNDRFFDADHGLVSRIQAKTGTNR